MTTPAQNLYILHLYAISKTAYVTMTALIFGIDMYFAGWVFFNIMYIKKVIYVCIDIITIALFNFYLDQVDHLYYITSIITIALFNFYLNQVDHLYYTTRFPHC